MGAKPDLEIIALIAKEMREDLRATTPEAVFRQIRQSVRGYELSVAVIETGGAVQATPLNGRFEFRSVPELIHSDHNTLFTSGTLGRFSKMLNAVIEAPGEIYAYPGKKVGMRSGSVQVEALAEKS